MDDRKDNPSKKQSRFQVAKVDFAVEKHSDDESSNEEDDHDQDADGQPDGQSWNACSYDTHNVRSLRHYTREALPRLDHYRNIMSVHGHMERPTLDELHNATLSLLPDQKVSSWSPILSRAASLSFRRSCLFPIPTFFFYHFLLFLLLLFSRSFVRIA